MGQAKQRGTYEQRVVEGIAKREAREAKQKAEWQAREDAMTPEQKAARANAVATMMAAQVAAATSLDAVVQVPKVDHQPATIDVVPTEVVEST